MEVQLPIDKQAEVAEQQLLEPMLLHPKQDQAVMVQHLQLTQHQLHEQVEAAVVVVPTLQILQEREVLVEVAEEDVHLRDPMLVSQALVILVEAVAEEPIVIQAVMVVQV